jgi:eukaryotic-like serine/threonine-protein kinase
VGWCMRLRRFFVRPLRPFLLCLLITLLTACNSVSMDQHKITHQTPTPVLAGGEPVLPHSQIFFHDAPLPTQVDLHFSDDTWTVAGHDGAATRSVEIPACCNAVTPAPIWYHSLNTPVLYAPVIDNGRIYLLASDGYLHVLNALSGAEKWRLPVGGDLSSNGLAVAHGLIYLALAGHSITALDASNGQERWRFDTGGVVRAAPLVVGRVLLITSGANSLWCLDALTGERYWVFHSEDTLAEFWPTRTTPAVSGGLVYVALGASNEFDALNLRTGRKVWEVALRERMTGGPMVDEASGLVYIVTWSGRVVALDAHSGAIRWDVHLAGGSETSPALSKEQNLLYLGSFDGSFYALDARTGQTQWQIQVGSPVTASPVMVQGAIQRWIIVASQGGMCLLLDDRSGKRLYSWNLGEIHAEPVVAQGVLYQASLGDQGLFAFRL